MAELQDYSGEFRPNLRMQDFSKDALIRLWKAGGTYALKISQFWTLMVMERFGVETALEMSRQIWLERGASEMEVALMRETMNLQGNDIASFFKHLQVDPGVGAVMEIECDLKSKNHGILTVKRCIPLEICEQLQSERLQKHICEEVDMPGFDIALKQFCPQARTTALKLPPRKSPAEIACQWEFQA